MKRSFMLYWVGVVLFLLNVVAFAVQGALFDGGLLLIFALIAYITMIYLYYASAQLRIAVILLSSTIGVGAILFSVIVYLNDGQWL
ncbi:hypothetical protein [Shouchella lonarensis]|uniref:Uncharacterized protein n=1 Tax=Shouchella lonarensis TaxID=1464122 RepID=A0A1G6HDU6_9BACI|nr:hypothetical protein [Shouchella lonarensis]SDB92449.1 hypothetical protein SAMN05421737_103228 [Shouchella lonarensis]